MSVLPPFELVRPGSLADALAVVDEDRAPYAGGTELVPAMRMGARLPHALVDLKRVPELHGIAVDEDRRTIRIGAATTHLAVTRSAAVGQHAPLLVAVADRVGNARVRSTGTVGGNLCFAEPRSDLTTVLVALRASVRLAGPGGERDLALDEFLVDAFETALGPNELMVSVALPFQPDGAWYWKLQSFERPTLGVATVVSAAAWEITIGAATARPVRAIVPVGDEAALGDLVDGVEIEGGLSGSFEYVREALRGYLVRTLVEAAS